MADTLDASSNSSSASSGESLKAFICGNWPDATAASCHTRLFTGPKSVHAEILEPVLVHCWTNELTGKAELLLTEKVIHADGDDHYTNWIYRRRLLVAMDVDLPTELDRCRRWCHEWPKTYQVWGHRKWLLEKTDRFAEELTHLDFDLMISPKNVNAWGLRAFIVKRLGNEYCEGMEEQFVDRMIRRDPRNHSVWNHRKLICEEGWLKRNLIEELEYTITWIQKIPANESPWLYLYSLFDDPLFPSEVPDLLQWHPIPTQCEDLLLHLEEHHHGNRFALGARLRQALARGNKADFEMALDTLSLTDGIRKTFYDWVKTVGLEKINIHEMGEHRQD